MIKHDRLSIAIFSKYVFCVSMWYTRINLAAELHKSGSPDFLYLSCHLNENKLCREDTDIEMHCFHISLPHEVNRE